LRAKELGTDFSALPSLQFSVPVWALLGQSSDKVRVGRKVRCHRRAVDFLAMSGLMRMPVIDDHPYHCSSFNAGFSSVVFQRCYEGIVLCIGHAAVGGLTL
jgi:hypothetical protein